MCVSNLNQSGESAGPDTSRQGDLPESSPLTRTSLKNGERDADFRRRLGGSPKATRQNGRQSPEGVALSQGRSHPTSANRT